jgi:hypothetical protein
MLVSLLKVVDVQKTRTLQQQSEVHAASAGASAIE